MPPNEAPGAKLAVWNSGLEGLRGKFDNLIGTGHAGLDVHGVCNHVYITWAPSGGASALQQFLPLNTQATKQLGFEQIRDKRTGQVVTNNQRIAKQLLEQDAGRPRDAQGQVIKPNGWLGPLSLAKEISNFGNEPPDFDIPTTTTLWAPSGQPSRCKHLARFRHVRCRPPSRPRKRPTSYRLPVRGSPKRTFPRGRTLLLANGHSVSLTSLT